MNQRAGFIEKIKQTLVNRKSEIDTQLVMQSHERLTDGVVQDSGDEALSLSMEKLQDSLQKSELTELHLIEDSLARIDKGEYGVCVDCGEAISEKRLDHFPYAARCIVCQEAFEQ